MVTGIALKVILKGGKLENHWRRATDLLNGSNPNPDSRSYQFNSLGESLSLSFLWHTGRMTTSFHRVVGSKMVIYVKRHGA